MRHAGRLRILALLTLSALLVGQIPPEQALVASEFAGTPATQLIAVDVVNGGAMNPLGGFPSDGLPPLAVLVDPIDGDVVIALAETASTSRVVRLTLNGLIPVSERLIGVIAGRVTDLAMDPLQGLVASVIGGAQEGVVVMGRNGPVIGVADGFPRAAALHASSDGSYFGAALQSGSSSLSLDPEVRWIDPVLGLTFTIPLPGVQPPEVVAFLDLPTALIRYVLAHPDGTVSLLTLGVGVQSLPLTPALPPGATTAMVYSSTIFDPLVLGNQAHPYISSFSVFTPTTWNTVAGPLPGNPVDFALSPPAGARAVWFGRDCPNAFGVSLNTSISGAPTLGSTNFALSVQGAVTTSPVYLALGLDNDVAFGFLPLPFTLSAGCQFQVDPLLLIAMAPSPTGFATMTIPVPNDPSLDGVVGFAQWIQDGGAGLYAVSNAIAIHLGL